MEENGNKSEHAGELQGEGSELLQAREGNEASAKKEPTIQNSRYCTTVLLVNVIATIPMINYGLTCLNPAIPVLQKMYNETYTVRYGEPLPKASWEALKALTMSMVVAGSFFGSITLKTTLHFLHRKHCAVLIHTINILGALIISVGGGLSKAWEPVIIGRFVMGMANGLALGLIPVIIGETCVEHRRERYDGLIGVCLAVGSLLGVIFGWSQVFGTAQLWPLIVVVPAIPSIIYIVVSKWLPDTPHEVLHSGDRSQLQRLMQELRQGSKDEISDEIRSIGGASLAESAEAGTKNQNKDVSLGEVLKTKQYRRQFIMVLLLFANLMLNGVNNVMFFSDSIFLQAGIKPDFVTVVTIIVFLFQVLATLPGSFILNRFGSWVLCIIGNIVMIVGHILVVASLATYENVPGMSNVAIAGIAIYLLGFSGCENIAVFPLVSEITLRETRPICVNFGCATVWLTGWFVGFIATYFQIWLGAYSFLVWMVCTILFTIYIVIFVPNTKNKTSEEIQKHFKKD